MCAKSTTSNVLVQAHLCYRKLFSWQQALPHPHFAAEAGFDEVPKPILFYFNVPKLVFE